VAQRVIISNIIAYSAALWPLLYWQQTIYSYAWRYFAVSIWHTSTS